MQDSADRFLARRISVGFRPGLPQNRLIHGVGRADPPAAVVERLVEDVGERIVLALLVQHGCGFCKDPVSLHSHPQICLFARSIIFQWWRRRH
jgi:hypothetical protein